MVETAHPPAIEPMTSTFFGALNQINAGVLNVGYVEAGPADRQAVVLLHGWPYDIHSFVDVAPAHVGAGYRVIVPSVRGYGTARFRCQEILGAVRTPDRYRRCWPQPAAGSPDRLCQGCGRGGWIGTVKDLLIDVDDLASGTMTDSPPYQLILLLKSEVVRQFESVSRSEYEEICLQVRLNL